MMKLAFISDIHGNRIALEAVLKDVKEKGVDQIIILGDLCFRGPEPKKSLDIVRELNAQVIKGNADEWVVRGIRLGEVPDAALEIMQREREWTLSQLNQEDVAYLNNLPTEVYVNYCNYKIHAFHATPTSLFPIVSPEDSDEHIIEKIIKKEADLYIYGHIHRSYIRYVRGKCVINTGSVGMPFDGIPQAAYALVELNKESIKTGLIRVKYNVEKSIQLLEQNDYPNKEFLKSVLKKGSL
jgi:putative phosphoesterase